MDRYLWVERSGKTITLLQIPSSYFPFRVSAALVRKANKDKPGHQQPQKPFEDKDPSLRAQIHFSYFSEQVRKSPICVSQSPVILLLDSESCHRRDYSEYIYGIWCC